MVKKITASCNLYLYIIIVTVTVAILSSFNDNIYVQARIYEEKSKRRLFSRRAAAVATTLLGTNAFFKYQGACAQKCTGMQWKYNCQKGGKETKLQDGKITDYQKCGAACITEAKKTPTQKGCCHFRNNQKDGLPCLYSVGVGVKSANKPTRYSGNCLAAPATCQQTGCSGANEECVASGNTYVCQCKSGYFNNPPCTSCSTCSGNTEISTLCTANANTQCSNCVKPSSASFNSNSGCSWTCNSGYYKSGNSCSQCTSTCTGHTYQSKACTSTQNRVCTSCTKPPQASWDSSNGCGWTCNAGYYKSGSSCNACTSSCTGNTQETSACTSTQNRICTSCTKPSNSVFSQATGCSWTCNSGYYKSGSNCLACTTCTAEQSETKSCTSTQNRECGSLCPSQPTPTSDSESTGAKDANDCDIWRCKVGYYRNGNTCMQCASTCKDYGTTREATIQDCNIEGPNRICQACSKPSLASWSSTNGCTYECNPGAYLDANAAITVTRLHSNSLQSHRAVSMAGDGKNILLGHGTNGGYLYKYDENDILSQYIQGTKIYKLVRTNHDGSRVLAVSEYSGNNYIYSYKNGIQEHVVNVPTTNVNAIGISIDGQHIYYSDGKHVYYSPNALQSTTENVPALSTISGTSGNIVDFCVSSDGKIAWYVSSQVAQEISPTGKGSKSKTITDDNFVAIACSADVKTIVIVTNTNVIYASSDSGANFVETKDLHNDKINNISVGATPFQSSFNNSMDGWDCGQITTCGVDVSASEGNCLAMAIAKHGAKVTATRSSLIVGSWNHVPTGCSVASGGDWAAHYNRKGGKVGDGINWLLVTDPNGGFGKICGGYNTKGKNRHITRSISPLKIGTSYTFSTDIIIGDSWDGEWFQIEISTPGNEPSQLCYKHQYKMQWPIGTDGKPNHGSGRNICKYNTISSPLVSHIYVSYIYIYICHIYFYSN